MQSIYQHTIRHWLLTIAAALVVGFAVAPAVAENLHPKNEVIAGEPASDAVLTTKIKARLGDFHAIETERVSVDVDDGVVTLEGMVPTAADKLATEREVKAIEGVKMVINSLEVAK